MREKKSHLWLLHALFFFSHVDGEQVSVLAGVGGCGGPVAVVRRGGGLGDGGGVLVLVDAEHHGDVLLRLEADADSPAHAAVGRGVAAQASVQQPMFGNINA